ncbi:hypothetical protein [Paenibacillus agricola]|uniref:Transposase n=1 Tax=Paenibacillus agricola TaxID=2716264 RepID=A0ABX0JGL4_9BACL|nr:hypothetical protein [Paenibacillus agricola]NHN34351.1 hypothetical protein [Paenibacillus agricola]
MKRVQYNLNFKMEIIRKGKESGNFTAVARQHELDPEMVLRWAKELNSKDVDQLDGASKRQAAFIPTAEDFKQMEHE